MNRRQGMAVLCVLIVVLAAAFAAGYEMVPVATHHATTWRKAE